jgi:hypothetical protein
MGLEIDTISNNSLSVKFVGHRFPSFPLIRIRNVASDIVHTPSYSGAKVVRHFIIHYRSAFADESSIKNNGKPVAATARKHLFNVIGLVKSLQEIFDNDVGLTRNTYKT